MIKPSPFKVIRKNVPSSKERDIYHDLLAMSWEKTFALFILFFLIIHSVFATLYWLNPGSLSNSDNSWISSFYFSVQTLGSIGYGYLSPATSFANILVTIQSFVGLIMLAIMSGLFFAKFSRPHSKIEFTDTMVITEYNGKKTLMFRMVNIRKNQIIDAAVTVNYLVEELTPEGHNLRRFVDLALERSTVPMFAMSMTLMHVIDETSPLFGLDNLTCKKNPTDFFVAMVGTDGTFGQIIHATHYYRSTDIEWGKRFKDMVKIHADGTREIDYESFNVVV